MRESIRTSRTPGIRARARGAGWSASNLTRRSAARWTAGLLAAALLSVPVARAAVPEPASGCPISSQELAAVSKMSALHGHSAQAMNEAYALVMRCPKDASARFELAKVEDRSGHEGKARASLAKAFSLDPSGTFAPKAQISRVRRNLHSFELKITVLAAVLALGLFSLLGVVAARVRRAARGTRPDAPSGTGGNE